MRMQAGILAVAVGLLFGCSGGGTEGSGTGPVTPTPTSIVGHNEVAGLHGVWEGTSSNGRRVWGVIVDDRYYFWYSAIGDPTMIRGAVTGTIAFNLNLKDNHVLESTDASDFSMDDRQIYHAILAGTFAPRSRLTGTMTIPNIASVQIDLTYQPNRGTLPGDPGPIGVANQADIVGTYDTGQPGRGGLPPATVTIAPDGDFDIVGYLDGFGGYGWETGICPNTDGSISPQNWGAEAYQFRFTIGCLFPARDVRGAGLYDAATRKLYLFAFRVSDTGAEQAFIHAVTKRP